MTVHDGKKKACSPLKRTANKAKEANEPRRNFRHSNHRNEWTKQRELWPVWCSSTKYFLQFSPASYSKMPRFPLAEDASVSFKTGIFGFPWGIHGFAPEDAEDARVPGVLRTALTTTAQLAGIRFEETPTTPSTVQDDSNCVEQYDKTSVHMKVTVNNPGKSVK